MSWSDHPIWWSAAVVLAIINLIAFTAHGMDKRAAVRGVRRIPEARLHLWELLGGWPGAILGMCLFRHKVRKASYLVVTILIVTLWVAGSASIVWFRSGG
ncbi:MAG: cold-shock protein [Phycisphaerae bacterium]|nr:cold-shock protein [Phycisphaerae bacterium]